MPLLKDVCRYIRSKNAGPFWITVDIFFKNTKEFERYADDAALTRDGFAKIFDVEAENVRRFAVPQLSVVKLSYPRSQPQGGVFERDMHGGQQYVRLLDINVNEIR